MPQLWFFFLTNIIFRMVIILRDREYFFKKTMKRRRVPQILIHNRMYDGVRSQKIHTENIRAFSIYFIFNLKETSPTIPWHNFTLELLRIRFRFSPFSHANVFQFKFFILYINHDINNECTYCLLFIHL